MQARLATALLRTAASGSDGLCARGTAAPSLLPALRTQGGAFLIGDVHDDRALAGIVEPDRHDGTLPIWDRFSGQIAHHYGLPCPCCSFRSTLREPNECSKDPGISPAIGLGDLLTPEALRRAQYRHFLFSRLGAE